MPDTPERLRSDAEPRYRVVGDLMPGAPNVLSWRLIPTADTAGLARYECRVLLDEVWGDFGNAGTATLTGQVLDLQRPLACPSRTTALWRASGPSLKLASAPR